MSKRKCIFLFVSAINTNLEPKGKKEKKHSDTTKSNAK
jgi:hypothetical protein